MKLRVLRHYEGYSYEELMDELEREAIFYQSAKNFDAKVLKNNTFLSRDGCLDKNNMPFSKYRGLLIELDMDKLKKILGDVFDLGITLKENDYIYVDCKDTFEAVKCKKELKEYNKELIDEDCMTIKFKHIFFRKLDNEEYIDIPKQEWDLAYKKL